MPMPIPPSETTSLLKGATVPIPILAVPELSWMRMPEVAPLVPTRNLMLSEVDGECLPYKVGKHQHLPEIIEGLHSFTGTKCEPFFTTHLLATRRGIVSSIYAVANSAITTGDLELVFKEAYADYPLVRAGAITVPKGKLAPGWMNLRSVVGSARCHIGFETSGNKVFLFSMIDNLLKGAAGQAVENLNRLFGWPVETGLLEQEGVL